jgi:phosphate transport system permease protein
MQRLASLAGNGFLLTVTSISAIAVLFIFFYIGKQALPFFRICGVSEFFTSTRWYPSAEDAEFGALAIIYGSAVVTFGAIVVAVPLGVSAAVCLSDIVPFGVRQAVKPVVEILAAIPSVAYGFFALILAAASWIVISPVAAIAVVVLSDMLGSRLPEEMRGAGRLVIMAAMGALAFAGLLRVSGHLGALSVSSGTNALNVSIILGIMALPTVVSVSEDALQAVGRELREGSYALGATRAETMVRVVIPAAMSGICAAVILGIMRAVGETMVVWMASGNSAKIPEPWYDLLEPVRTLTATIAGDMGEADHVTGSARYHVLFALALVLFSFSFGANVASEWVMRRSARV